MVTSKQSQDIGRLEGKIDGLSLQIEHLEKKMLGNGQPGIVQTVAETTKAFELHCTNSEKTFEKIASTLGSVSKGMEDVRDLVDKHHADKSQHTIWGQITWKAAAVIIATIAIITIIVPQEVSVWQFIAKLFGL
jgi:hypothetical protein